MNQLADIIDRHRKLLSVLIVCITLAAFTGIVRLEFALDPQIKTDRKGPDYAWLQRLDEAFGSDSLDCILLVRGDDIFTPGFIAGFRELLEAIQQIEGVERVISLDDVPVFSGLMAQSILPADPTDNIQLQEAREKALSHPLLAGHLVSADATTTLIMVRLSARLETISQYIPIVKQIRSVCRRMADQGGFEISVTGRPAMRVDMRRFMRWENLKLFTIPNIIGFFIALILFKRISAILLVVLVPLVGVIWTMGAAGWIHGQWTMISLAIPTMVYIVGFTDAVHLMLHMRREIKETGASCRQAALSAVRQIGSACALTSLTTAIGFGSLVLAGSPQVRNLGISCAIGSLLTFVTVITLVPILAGTALGRRSIKNIHTSASSKYEFFFTPVIGVITHRPKTVAICGTLLTLLLAASALKLRIGSNDDWVPYQLDSIQAYYDYSDAFGGGSSVHVFLSWPDNDDTSGEEIAAALKDIHALIEEETFVSRPLSAWNILESTLLSATNNRLEILRLLPDDFVGRFIRFDSQCALVTARFESEDINQIIAAFDRMQEKLLGVEEKHPGIDVHLTGPTVLAVRALHQIIIDLGKSLMLAAVIITAVMLLAFRSLRYGLICLIPNIFPLAVISAALVLTSQPLSVSHALLFTICLGIAVDDTIHFISRYRDFLQSGCDPATAARKSFYHVGRAIFITTLILIAGFGSVCTSSLTGYKIFAAFSCLGFAAALIGDLFILPALLILANPAKRTKQHDHL